MEKEERLCNEEETVREVIYLGDWVSVGEGCEAAVTARTRCGWLSLGSAVSSVWQEISSKDESGCLQELCKAKNTEWK